MNWIKQAAKAIDQESIALAQAHQAILTKPAGSLGRLEQLAEQFAGWQSATFPSLNNISVVVFAGDHGVCQQGVSAFPQAVTSQMIINFLEGGAAISVLSQSIDASLTVCNMGTVAALPESYLEHSQLLQKSIASGTADFSQTAAMTNDQVNQALNTGREIANELKADLFIGGEMGIGNTSSASAIYAALLTLNAETVVGTGTGIDQEGLLRKQRVISEALILHKAHLENPYEILRCLGGLEIAALVGCYIACAQRGIPVLVDGFICTAAALLATKINPSVRAWLLFSHQSAEQAHVLALEDLNAQPLVNLGLRLGEGSGAALVVPLIRSSLILHQQMATFIQAGVSEHE